MNPAPIRPDHLADLLRTAADELADCDDAPYPSPRAAISVLADMIGVLADDADACDPDSNPYDLPSSTMRALADALRP